MERHLRDDVLARLVDESPTHNEEAHLKLCSECSARLAELREQSVALGRLPDLRPPRGDWAALEARMASEGLVRPEPNLLSRLVSTPTWMRTAAAIALFVGGMGAGLVVDPPTATITVNGVPGSGTAPMLVADARGAHATTLDEAAAWVRLKEREFRDALVQYAQLSDESGVISNPEARMASLDYAIVAVQAGLEEAPADPVLNGFLASMMAERDHTLRQISNSVEYY
ncbi:MAG: hypothetical protein RQ745_01940 [Longimicrobiales bacterium]|nr:hypothetical protein [Longimicrobiales bacterium]